jgi:FkbM family methyltransferase
MGQYQSFIEKVVEPLEPGDVFIDVGANMGMFSLAASAKVGPSGLVLAFEPSLREYNELVRNLTLNAAHNVLPFRLGLGETTLATEMSVADESISGCNRIGILENEDLSCSIQTAFLTSFDSLPFARLLSSSQRVFVKLDTEGHEYSALVGMSQFLRRSNVISIIAELDEVLLNRFGHSVQEVVDLLFDIGFVAASDVTVEHGDYWFQRRATEQHDRHAATANCLVGD